MSILRQFDMRAGDYADAERRIKAEKRGHVVRWLKQNPLSTAKEIWKATGVSINSVSNKKMFKSVKYTGKICWRVLPQPENKI